MCICLPSNMTGEFFIFDSFFDLFLFSEDLFVCLVDFVDLEVGRGGRMEMNFRI